ncbi:MAG: T9SS type A sorting domain-containing protein [Bacteroidetes bacterium]|nr:T9SS type A sorting domain-containing protein [Bacteroidota bacterium]
MKTRSVLLLCMSMVISIPTVTSQDIPPSLSGHSAYYSASESKTYLFGGYLNGMLEYSNEIWVCNQYGQFSRIEPNPGCPLKPPARANHTSWLHNGFLYISGGVNATSNCISDTWRFNLSTRCWELVSNTGPCLSRQATVLPAGSSSVYLIGGRTGANQSSAGFYSLNLNNPASGFSSLPALPEPLMGSGGFQKNGNAHIFGGMWHDWDPNTPGNQPSYSQNIWKYSVQSGWEMVPATGTIDELYGMAGTQDPAGTYYYVFGGYSYNYSNNTQLFSNKIFRLNTNSFNWMQLPVTMPEGMADFTATYIPSSTKNANDTILLIGGILQSGANIPLYFKFSVASNTLSSFIPTGLDQTATKPLFEVHPNPVHDLLHLSLPENELPDRLTIFDAQGRCLKEIANEVPDAVAVGFLKAGVYKLCLSTAKHVYTTTFVKY